MMELDSGGLLPCMSAVRGGCVSGESEGRPSGGGSHKSSKQGGTSTHRGVEAGTRTTQDREAGRGFAPHFPGGCKSHGHDPPFSRNILGGEYSSRMSV